MCFGNIMRTPLGCMWPSRDERKRRIIQHNIGHKPYFTCKPIPHHDCHAIMLVLFYLCALWVNTLDQILLSPFEQISSTSKYSFLLVPSDSIYDAYDSRVLMTPLTYFQRGILANLVA